MANIEKQYLSLLDNILEKGHQKKDRTGTGTISVFGRQIRHDMKEGFPLLTTKKMAWNAIVTELLWFLRSDTNIKYLLDNNNHIWDGDAYKFYIKNETESLERWKKLNPSIIAEFKPLPKEEFVEKIKTDPSFALKYGDLGPIYGEQWRNWKVEGENTIDQIREVLRLLKEDPDSRRILVNAWNPGQLKEMALPPCHYSFQLYTRDLSLTERLALAYKKLMGGNKPEIEMNADGPKFNLGFNPMDYHNAEQIEHLNIPKKAVSLMWNQRSVDCFLGLPFNIASYALLLSIIAKECGMQADELIGNLGDTHIYNNHVDQVREQLKRDPYDLPELDIKLHFQNSPSFVPMSWLPDDFGILNYKFHPAIKAPLSN